MNTKSKDTDGVRVLYRRRLQHPAAALAMGSPTPGKITLGWGDWVLWGERGGKRVTDEVTIEVAGRGPIPVALIEEAAP